MTDIKIINGKFYVNGAISNCGSPLSEGRLVGVFTDMCAFFDANITDIDKNKREFIENLGEWKKSGVDLITVGLQSPNPFREYYKKAREQDKEKNLPFESSAIKRDGSLNLGYLENSREIIEAADNMGFAVLVNILSPSCEDIFEDEFAILNGTLNAAGWLAGQGFSNVIVNITDVAHTFYKSSVLKDGRIIKVLKSVRQKVKEKLILGAGIKSFTNISAKNMREYIELSDFIPLHANYTKSNHNTKRMLEKIYFVREKMRAAGREIPVIIAKGDDLSEKYNSYGKNNLLESLENGASWCYYDKDGFVIMPVSWDKNSSDEKKRFFDGREMPD
jgi:hypothetical protein